MPRPPDLKDILRRYEPTKLGFIFDFDGTLADLRDDPAAVDLSQEVIHALARLHQATNESVFVLSGRPMDFLESIFGAHIHLIAEHGAQSSLKLPGLPPPKRPMPPEARQFLQELTTQNPGSFIETKRTSLVWH
jgi:trehalose-phosphatase